MGLEDLVTPGNLEDRFEVGKVVGQVRLIVFGKAFAVLYLVG